MFRARGKAFYSSVSLVLHYSLDMGLATANLWEAPPGPHGRKPGRARLPARFPARLWLSLFLLLTIPVLGQNPAVESTNALAGGVAFARAELQSAKARHLAEPKNLEAAWQFGRTCFELGEFATTKAQRAALAEEGIAACRLAVAGLSNGAPAHYYLGLNYGQLARTRGLSALKLVSQMRDEWELARGLDEQLDSAGPDRHLGLLYRDAPALGSIGSRKEARRHLLRAVELAGGYPENRLVLIESYVKWGERPAAQRELKALERIWPAARAKLTGPAWASRWADWESQLRAFKASLGGETPTR